MKTDSETAMDSICLMMATEKSRIIFFSSLTLQVISGHGKKVQSIQFLFSEHEHTTPVFSHLQQLTKTDKDFHSFQINKAEN